MNISLHENVVWKMVVILLRTKYVNIYSGDPL